MEWWNEIESQIKQRRARVYIPDICIAETFKVLAKKYYQERWFRSPQDLGHYRAQLRKVVSLKRSELRKANRFIAYHDIATTRDIIVSVDRFFELFLRHKKWVSVPDLIVVATAKYLMDFYDAPKENLHIVTLDKNLRDGSRIIQELPNAYNPTYKWDRCNLVFQ